ncbi:hypothetical protein [Microbacterium oleivorans]|uniref:Uncharacterized protein n=1 Tax=Microbacterium oleivorans TaxID=273677 RepID=A0A031FV88_9MICO|nr:hypothetical protein [Microbacterium oleivorans]AZS42995.1 hypothetical protein BWL13_00537 [Microbacterium oleivorans]EZP28167.1 hypothetical protein BW34_01144 [Microbacterium oleivorans]
MGGLVGWHLLILLGVLVIIALIVGGIYWIVRLAARHGSEDAAERRSRVG